MLPIYPSECSPPSAPSNSLPPTPPIRPRIVFAVGPRLCSLIRAPPILPPTAPEIRIKSQLTNGLVIKRILTFTLTRRESQNLSLERTKNYAATIDSKRPRREVGRVYLANSSHSTRHAWPKQGNSPLLALK